MSQINHLLSLWEGGNSNPSKRLEEEGYIKEFWSMLSNFKLLNCQQAFFYPTFRQFEKYEVLTFSSPSSWYVKLSEIQSVLRQEFPVTFLAFHSTESIFGMPNEFNTNYKELILAPIKLQVVNREVQGKYIIYFVTTLKETSFDFNIASKICKQLANNSLKTFEAIKVTFPNPQNFEQFTNCMADPYNIHSMRMVPFNFVTANPRIVTPITMLKITPSSKPEPVDSRLWSPPPQPPQTPEEFADSVLRIPNTFF